MLKYGAAVRVRSHQTWCCSLSKKIWEMWNHLPSSGDQLGLYSIQKQANITGEKSPAVKLACLIWKKTKNISRWNQKQLTTCLSNFTVPPGAFCSFFEMFFILWWQSPLVFVFLLWLSINNTLEASSSALAASPSLITTSSWFRLTLTRKSKFKKKKKLFLLPWI